MTEAHLREDQQLIEEVENLGQLHNKTPEELLQLTTMIHDKHASNESINKIDDLPTKEFDEVKYQAVMGN